jgi:hypothetical protein
MATLFPFGASFNRAPYEVTREYRTEILVSRNGKEQRRALRQTPRKRIDYLTALCDDNVRAFDRAMVTAQRIQLTIPERVRFVEFEDGLPPGFSAVVVDPMPSWIYEGAVLVLDSGFRLAYRTVASVVDDTVTFEEDDDTAWAAPTRISPALDGYLESTIPAPLTSRTHGVVEASITFNVDPGSEVAEDTGAATDTLAGREVFLVIPDRWQEIGIDRVQDGAAATDYGFGRIRRFFPISFSTRMWEAQYTGCDFDHADAIRQFFCRMMGRQHEFYMPTWQQDLIPVSGISSGGTTITVEGTETDATFDPSTTYKAVAIRKDDGAWITRTVSGIAPSAGNSVITVGSAWGDDVAVDGMDLVSWLPLWRFSSDTMTMSWPREDVAHIKLAMQMIENLAVESDVAVNVPLTGIAASASAGSVTVSTP